MSDTRQQPPIQMRSGRFEAGGIHPGGYPPPPPAPSGAGAHPSAYWPLTIVSVLFSWPIGLAAMYFSYQVGERWRTGDTFGSAKASRLAKIWGTVGVSLGAFFWLLFIIALIAAASSSGDSSTYYGLSAQ